MKTTFFPTAIAAIGLALFFAQGLLGQGIYSGPTDTTNLIDGAIPSGSALFTEFADAIDATRTRFTASGSETISTTDFNSLGDLTAAEIANGDLPGFLTVTFPTGIANGTGSDFAVFENGFVFPSDPNLFAELAYVEVSSNGTDFARFQSISTNTTFAGTFGQGFGGFDTTNIFNLAGKHANGFGTPFDLDDLAGDVLVSSGLVDLNDIQYLRLVDVPGSGDFLDSAGNPILDAWPGNGFDFQLGQTGVGVINQVGTTSVPEPSGGVCLFAILLAVTAKRKRSFAKPSTNA